MILARLCFGAIFVVVLSWMWPDKVTSKVEQTEEELAAASEILEGGGTTFEDGTLISPETTDITGAPQNPIIRRIMNVVEPLRRFDLRKAFTDMVRRAASFFAPQTLQQARNGRMVVK
ncbi:hypothetical protein Avbf_11723, partial [Armadillidium vulgare]